MWMVEDQYEAVAVDELVAEMVVEEHPPEMLPGLPQGSPLN